MPVKKTVTKTTAKNAEAKKVSTNEKKVETRKPTVIVETKKVESEACKYAGKDSCCNHWCCPMKLIILILIVLNLLLSICSLCCNKSAWNLEALKVGWKENLEKLEKIYTSDAYVNSNREYLESYLEQVSQ